MKAILKDILYNFWLPILLGTIGFIGITMDVSYFDESDIVFYYISIILCSAGTIASLIYGIKKYFKG